jgi:outer membrane protein OmpA-like peptidoglycan-associated protein
MAQDMDTFDPSGALFDDQGTLQAHAASLGRSGSWDLGLMLSYARNPLLVRYEGVEDPRRVVGDQMAARLMGGRVFGSALRLDVELPTYPLLVLDGESRVALGDLQIGALVPLRKISSGPLSFALAPTLEIPTGSNDAWVSNDGLGLALAGVVSGEAGPLRWTGNVGLDLTRTATARVSDPSSPLALGSMDTGSALLLLGGLSHPFDERTLAGLELGARLDMAKGFANDGENPVEAHVYGTHGTRGGLILNGGLGTGLVAGVGAPALRLFAGVGYRRPGSPDTDHDGRPDPVDACPTQPEDIDGYQDEDGCPDLDNDADGLPDLVDRCPMEPEDVDGFEDLDGCPDPDNDSDTVLDPVDVCPLVAGPPQAEGCPDTDGDRVPDYRDRCPTEAGDPRLDPAHSDGCPTRVFVSKERIEILERIFFDVNKVTVKKESYDLLLEVARVLNANPHIKQVEVQGHTDSMADDAYNLKLSQGRVEAVVRFLVEQGAVDPARLVPRGYGETRPVETNLTDEGRTANRRVEFLILEQD